MRTYRKLNSIFFISLLTAGILTIAISRFAGASGITVYEDGDKYVKMGGRIQLQYNHISPEEGDSSDKLFLRRFRPYIEGSLHKDWKGKFQWDMGAAEDENEITIKDAYMQYKGFSNMKITMGNANFPFSRELLTSSKKQQLVERTFVGNHNFGTPDRNAGIHLTGHNNDKKLTYGFSVASAYLDPDARRLDFDTPVNRFSDFNEGWIVGGRVDFHPLGHLKFSQGDFKRETKATIGVGAYGWNNDDDNNTYTDDDTGESTNPDKVDVDSVTGFEISGAFRGAGFSIDAEYNIFKAETIDSGFTGGIYENGDTDIENYAIEGGYMILPDMFELVAGYEVQDADNYEEEWNRISFGVNWFIKKHDIKVQLTYRMGENINGVEDNDADIVFLQTQYVF